MDKTLLAISGGVLNSFLALHFLNTISRLLGAATYDGLQDSFRLYYQHPAVEIGLLVSLCGHVGLGLLAAGRRWSRWLNGGGGGEKGSSAAVPMRMKLFRLSGLVLASCVFGHIVATRGHSLYFGHKVSGAQIVEFSLVAFPGKLVMLPYYLVFSAAGVYHSLYGGVRATQILLPRSLRPRFLSGPLFEPVVLGSVLSVWCGVLAFSGLIGALGSASEYPTLRHHYEEFVPEMAHFLLPWKRT
jgi:succinate dehydrogenase/fumarate reductase cytochrome b subunit